jgi:hypothetical protein
VVKCGLIRGLIGWVEKPSGEDFAGPSTVGSPILLRVLKIPLFQTGGKTGFFLNVM